MDENDLRVIINLKQDIRILRETLKRTKERIDAWFLKSWFIDEGLDEILEDISSSLVKVGDPNA